LTIFDENPLIRVLRDMSEINLDHFDNRLRLQKLGFLAQEMGINGGFPFSWYIYGPYSSSLTSVLFLGEEVEAFNEPIQLTEPEQNVVNNLQQLFGEGIDDSSTLELFGSVWYLMSAHPASDELGRVMEIMNQEKPQYADGEVADAFRRILEFRQQH